MRPAGRDDLQHKLVVRVKTVGEDSYRDGRVELCFADGSVLDLPLDSQRRVPVRCETEIMAPGDMGLVKWDAYCRLGCGHGRYLGEIYAKTGEAAFDLAVTLYPKHRRHPHISEFYVRRRGFLRTVGFCGRNVKIRRPDVWRTFADAELV